MSRHSSAAYDHAYYVANREQIKDRAKKWLMADPSRWRVNARIQAGRRRGRRIDLPATLTASEWAETLAYFGHRCAYCLVPLDAPVQEHMVPVVRDGGYTQENIVPACIPCNQRKGAGLMWDVL